MKNLKRRIKELTELKSMQEKILAEILAESPRNELAVKSASGRLEATRLDLESAIRRLNKETKT